jgi:hypothetical protein
MSIAIPPKCEACKDTGEVEMRIQYSDRRRTVPPPLTQQRRNL